MAVVIRPVTKTDLVAVRAQLIETWHATYDTIYGPDMVREITHRWHSFIALAAQIDVPGSVFLLAEESGTVLASSFATGEQEMVKLYRLYVRPSAQRRRLGHRLMSATFALFPAATRHRLEVQPQNLTAIAFYESEGFARIGEIADSGRVDGVAAYIYERVVD